MLSGYESLLMNISMSTEALPLICSQVSSPKLETISPSTALLTRPYIPFELYPLFFEHARIR